MSLKTGKTERERGNVSITLLKPAARSTLQEGPQTELKLKLKTEAEQNSTQER